MVRPPVGEIVRTGSGEEAGGIEFAYSDGAFRARYAALKKAAAPFTALRYRGLASISPAVLRVQCIVPETRRVEVVSNADVQLAARLFGGA